ncbi:PAS domain S-box-containing protein [Actinocorallia herbida]|uniref:Sensor-like histidine kinase SenX3 n=1 Tax=Actinocorallia herbida TaxID=58109 RepID=A0A3N1CYP2_9ACTN|nr:PAS domain-containing sensor histidine kinase [Actinocorallia herbida]ROO86395.1 PAS domain S-box-containing protein [Actinocorallia herbida]
MDEVDFAAVFDAMPIPTSVLSPDGTFLTVNRAYEKASGRSREELVGAKLIERFPGGPADQGPEAVQASLARVVAEHRIDVMPLLRYDVESPEGVVEERYWSLMNAPVFGPDGEVRYIIHRGEEATDFVRKVRGRRAASRAATPEPSGRGGLFGLEARLQVIEADLYARTSELQADNLRLHGARERDTRDADRLRREMEKQRRAVADTSHDLRGPITGLQTRLQVALEDPLADPQDILRAALLDAERLGAIVGDLLELARLDARAPTKTAPVDLAEIVRTGLGHRSAGEPEIGTLLAKGAVVQGSAVRLARVVDNLIDNAARHAGTRIEVEVAVEGGHAVLRVHDDGPGIPEEDREAVFARFYRRADARAADPSGTGLGLAISREIAHAHGGTLHVADSATGALLELRIPLRVSPTAGSLR